MKRSEKAKAGPKFRVGGRHGIDCEKVRHIVGQCYTHAPDDDSPYDVDGIYYCGRCHAWIELESGQRQQKGSK